MKKLLFGMVAIFCCLAFVGPALAKVTMGGMIDSDAYWTKDSKELAAAKNAAPVVNDAATRYESESYTYININRALTRFDMRYESDDKLILALMEIRYGDQNLRTNFDSYYAWIDWRPGGENMHFRFGQQPETFAIMAPGAANIGYNTNSTLLVNFGNLHASSIAMAKAYFKFTDMVRMEFAVCDPGSNINNATDEGFLPANQGVGFPAVTEQSTIPRFDIAIPIKIGNFTVEPSATWLNKNLEYVNGALDDSFDIWGTSLGAKASFGPFSILGEITYGENLANGNYTGAGNKPPISPLGTPWRATARINTAGELSDTEYLGWWLMGEFDFGPFGIQFAYGQEKIQNNDLGTATIAGVASTGEILDTTRRGAALRFPIKVAKGFEIAPNIQYFDFDNAALTYGRNFDLGTEWVAGVQFNLVF